MFVVAISTYLKKVWLQIYITHSKLESNFLQPLGTVQNNSFTNIIDPNPEDNQDTNEPVIISHSSYYD